MAGSETRTLRSALPEGEQLVEETWALGRKWEQLDQQGDASLKGIAQQWEADWIYLDSTTFTLAGGCVCFPSSWNPQESTGKTLAQVHGVMLNWRSRSENASIVS